MPTKKTKPVSAKKHVESAAAEIVHVQIDPHVGRLTHTVRGVKFVAGQVRAYDLSDPKAREFVDSELRTARKLHGREDTPHVFLVETAAQSIARTRAQEEARRSPLGSAAAPIRGQVPQKAAPTRTSRRGDDLSFQRAG
jgi:hypothetical protein